MAIEQSELLEIEEDTIFAEVEIEKMFVHERGIFEDGYARPENPNRVRKLDAEFDPMALGVILLSLRDDGSYAVIDGRHRVKVAQAHGMTKLSAYVYLDLTLEEEARLYRKFGDYLKQTALDRFAAATVEREPETLAIDKLLAEVGLHVAYHGGSENNGVKSVSAIQKVAKDLGPQVLRETLHVLHAAFGGKPQAYTSSFIIGTSMFIDRFRKHPRYRTQTLVEKLGKEGITGLIQRAAGVKAAEGAKGGNAFGRALLHCYHKGISEASPNHLGPWPTRSLSVETITKLRTTINNGRPKIQEARADTAKSAKSLEDGVICPKCGSKPGADCRNPRGAALNDVHWQRIPAARAFRELRKKGAA